MSEKQEQDQAKSEPVQPAQGEFMDTGVLHERPKSVRGQHATKKDGDDE